jgi:hypothetical protein
MFEEALTMWSDTAEELVGKSGWVTLGMTASCRSAAVVEGSSPCCYWTLVC